MTLCAVVIFHSYVCLPKDGIHNQHHVEELKFKVIPHSFLGLKVSD